MITKICNQCKRELPISEFYKSRSCKFGVSSKCKDCDNIRLNNNKKAQKYLKRLTEWAEKGDIIRSNKVKKTRNKDDKKIVKVKYQEAPNHKICKTCHRELLFSEFYKSKHGRYGLANNCKKCNSEEAKKNYRKRIRLSWEERQRIKDGVVPKIPEFKVCHKCHQKLPIDSFGKNKNGEFGISNSCRDCESARHRKYYRTEKRQNSLRDWAEQQVERRKSQKYKLCTGCNRELPLDEFFNKKNGKFGVEVLCKECKQKKNVKYRYSDKGKAAGKRAWNKRRTLKGTISTLTNDEWEEIKKRYNYKCVYCGEKKALTQDHIIPISKGGHHTKDNVIPACQPCNSRKSNKTVLLQLLALAS
jgi:uncharacterized CHY-type Zn-finger protein